MSLPVALSAAILLGLLGVSVGEAGLGEELGKMLGLGSGTVGDTDVVAIVVLVRASHLEVDCPGIVRELRSLGEGGGSTAKVAVTSDAPSQLHSHAARMG
ncbi:uncharacterized protein K452DRAFT_20974 [Aplosporella prunicola CBS 121167]|uniref:Uncharacterized protein n=1 Tax=Aplosporella prunicola CBS 121167 TaxID=1176127 RepID=A0A6A6BH37_9PEZI|nr:uncharacterized protein K452DRAFT_20974 [Aplosporella prunicola CBS 121167]KAF2142574.1 hypothetical protein K452DRAFT_20974 [Aplosporella prunicola CBS 121167]